MKIELLICAGNTKIVHECSEIWRLHTSETNILLELILTGSSHFWTIYNKLVAVQAFTTIVWRRMMNGNSDFKKITSFIRGKLTGRNN